MGNNIRLVVEVAKRYSEQLTPKALIALFEEFDSWSGIYYYLGSFVNFAEVDKYITLIFIIVFQDSDVVFKYIEAATKLDQLKEVERVCRDSEHYDPLQVKEFLLQHNLKDPRPLIYVCDRHGFVDELTSYLYNNNMYPFIEAYIQVQYSFNFIIFVFQKMNPASCPKVIGALLDLNAPEDRVRELVTSVRPPQCPVKELVEEVEKRNRFVLKKLFC